MTKEYFQLPPEDIDNYWTVFAPKIDEALTKAGNDDYSLEGIYWRLKSNVLQLFFILNEDQLETMFVTSVTRFDKSAYLTPLFITSMNHKNKTNLKFLQSCLIEIAKQYGCNKIFGGGRKGWSRVLKKLGYKKETFMTLTLE